MDSQLDTLFSLIDKANSADPVLEPEGDSEEPRALLYGRRMSACLEILRSDAPLELRIAVRAQHIGRWRIARNTYPAGRGGYLKWRRDLARYHAEQTAELMRPLGLDETCIERVQHLLQKKNRRHDADTQTLEDAASLVFLQYYLADLCRTQEDEKMIPILAGTWRKMSPRAHELALALDYDPVQRRLIDAALKTI